MAPKRVSWSEKDMAAAVYAVKNNILPTRTAAAIYRIPSRTLRDYVKRDRRAVKRPRESTPDDDLTNEDKKADMKPIINNNTETSYFNMQPSWYCYACSEDRIADMRQCDKCIKWYHEDCVGLISDDVDPFECPTGCTISFKSF